MLKMKGETMKKALLLIICMMMVGCSFTWNTRASVGARGVNAEGYGQLEGGMVIYESNKEMRLFK